MSSRTNSRTRRAAVALTAAIGLAACTAQPTSTANIDPHTGLPGCTSRDGVLWANGGNRPVQSPNSLPPGAKDLSSSCAQHATAQPYVAQ